FKDIAEMLGRSRSPRGDHRHGNGFDDVARVADVIAGTHAVVAHAVEHDLSGSARGRFAHPLERFHPAVPAGRRTASVLLHPIRTPVEETVHPEADALAAEVARKLVNQLGPL